MSKYKYLYEIEYLNAKEGQARFYLGSRVSELPASYESYKIIKYYIKV